MAAVSGAETPREGDGIVGRRRQSVRRLVGFLEAPALFWRRPPLRPLGVSRLAGSIAEWAWYTAATIEAFRLGGVGAVGVIAVASVLPAALLSPVLGYLIDRAPRHRVLLGAAALRAAALLLAAAAFATTLPVALLALFTALEGVATLVIRPASTAFLPQLTRRPAELVSAQATLGAVDGAGLLAGSLLGGAVVSSTSPGVAFTFAGVVALVAVTAAWRLPAEQDHAVVGHDGDEEALTAAWRESLRGLPAVIAEDAWLVSVLLWTAQLLAGATEVLVVVIAFDLLGLPAYGPGLLTAALGLGGLVGAGALASTSGRRLLPWFAAAMVMIGGALALAAAVEVTAVAVALMGLLGAGTALALVAAQTQLARIVAPTLVGRALGIAEAVGFGAMAVGAALTPRLVEGLGARPALVVLSGLGPVVVLVLAAPLRVLDRHVARRVDEIAALDDIAFLDPLPNATRARIASRVEIVDVAEGDVIVTQGEWGDTFFVVDRGRFEVQVDGQPLRALGPGEFFGELALMSDAPRSATVVATEAGQVRELAGHDFLAIVTGHEEIGAHVTAVADERRRDRPAEPAESAEDPAGAQDPEG